MAGEARTGGTPGQDATGRRRVSVGEASRELRISTEAIRKRMECGTIPHERDKDGRVWIFLEESGRRHPPFYRAMDMLSSDVYAHEVHRAVKHIVEWVCLSGSHHDVARAADRAG